MTVDARDVASAMISAVECGRSGERYIIGGQKTTLATILKTLEDVSGVRGPRLHIPYVAADVCLAFGNHGTPSRPRNTGHGRRRTDNE